MIEFIQTHQLGINYKFPVEAINGIKGEEQRLRFLDFCKEYCLVIHHWWPYYADDDISEVSHRFDMDPIADDVKVIMKLVF